ncbi:DNA primase large subunit-like [Branchiostoma floridae]|uniref:DNA primase large subunit n=1 Tax=Branchiostoma floridae TaxID=7739 RepID=A0A9J7KL70_BRAFL|nr:DNA primase large subunit-like [Branchiostoma floridae]
MTCILAGSPVESKTCDCELFTYLSKMQFSGNRTKKSRRTVTLTGGRNEKQYPHNLQFYKIPPTETVSLEEFETFAIDRLKVLKSVESAGIKYMKTSEQYQTKLEQDIKKLMPIAVRKTDVDGGVQDKDYDDRRKDHISHFILRLAYCKSEDLRRWFLTQEMDLFRFRFQQESKDAIGHFLQLNNLDYQPIPEEEKKALRDELKSSSYEMKGDKFETTDFYKVPFQEALDLVRARKVYLKKGYVYVPQSELVSIILSAFRENLSKALAVSPVYILICSHVYKLVVPQPHSTQYLGQDYSNRKSTAGKVAPEDIEPLSKKSFPLCMRNLQETLRREHHLRHGGRMQYGLFLKGIGLQLEDALRFWRSEFTKMMDGDKFDKSYSYNIRHNYGKEGKRTDYTPYSCMKVIMTNAPAVGDHHGCPFRHTDPELLNQRLQGYRVNTTGVQEIIELVKGGHYQLACTKYFEITHNVDDAGFGLNHPNQYFEESQKVLNGGHVPKTAPRTPSTQRSKPIKKETEDFDDDFPMDEVEHLLTASQDVVGEVAPE